MFKAQLGHRYSIQIAEISGDFIHRFANPLHRFNGENPWALGLAPLPDGMEYADMVKAGVDSIEYLQAAGSTPETITVEIRKPGGQQWAAATPTPVFAARAESAARVVAAPARTEPTATALG